MNIKSKIILLLNLLYCYIPVFLFLLGWVKLWIAIPTSVVLCYFLYIFIAKEESNKELHISRIILTGGGIGALRSLFVGRNGKLVAAGIRLRET